ncbi:uncharacterized protein LOC131226014 isoform X4 [Magnolia sinica]|uniref:uncharacterized protein LOC131226014 isoform X4 n=1 Tax=Magnolia sinica TaxID=86752 RepID=UPI00265A6901|nr:uncharacterized protein LOC131226014 isoform X4 [Magnolia sinica]
MQNSWTFSCLLMILFVFSNRELMSHGTLLHNSSFFLQFHQPINSSMLLRQQSCWNFGNVVSEGSRGLQVSKQGWVSVYHAQVRVMCLQMIASIERYEVGTEAKICDRGESNATPYIQTLRKLPLEELSGKVVMVRFDSTLLLREAPDIEIQSVNRALFTIKYLYNAGAKLLLASDWGRSKNSVLLSTQAVADHLSSVIQLKVMPANGISGYRQPKMEESEKTDILLLENLSKSREEFANCVVFAEKLSSGVEIFVNDAFSLSHKILASTVGVARFCHSSVAGFCFEEELSQIMEVVETTQYPYLSIIGGGNLLEKATALRHLASKCDGLVFIGRMAFQIMHALGLPVSLKFVEHGAVEEAAEIIRLARHRNIPILFPKDFWCVSDFPPKIHDVFPSTGILNGWTPVGLGPSSLSEIFSLLLKSKAYPFELDWNAIFADPSLPLTVDIGSGNGLFLFKVARRCKSVNFLGLEINKKLVKRCLDFVQQQGLKNVYFISTNATTTFRSITSSYLGEMVLVSIQCPNPDFNKTEQRWRMLQRGLIEAIAELLATDGKVFLQSDIVEVAIRMKEQFLMYGKGRLHIVDGVGDIEVDDGGWLKENPFGIRSDWEQHVVDRGAPMYRLLMAKVDVGGSNKSG